MYSFVFGLPETSPSPFLYEDGRWRPIRYGNDRDIENLRGDLRPISIIRNGFYRGRGGLRGGLRGGERRAA